MIIAGILALICGLAVELFFRGLLVLSDRLFGRRHGVLVTIVCLFVAFALGFAALFGADIITDGSRSANALAFIFGVGISRWLMGDIRA